MDGLNPNIRLKNGNYYIADTMAENAYIHVVICKNVHNISETRVSVVGKKQGQPPADYIAICESDVLKLQRQQNIRKRQTFLGF